MVLDQAACSKDTVARSARVSKSWSRIALERLWATLHSPIPLLELLGKLDTKRGPNNVQILVWLSGYLGWYEILTRDALTRRLNRSIWLL